ncbi:MAG: chemotaxis protein CheB [Alphaproteobacteria bacterium]|nr:chemotaxis protein CheB [Alphaproteobacteria bacterium]
MPSPRYEAIVMGLSAGGMQALKTIIAALPPAFPVPLAIAQHTGESSDGFLADYLTGLGGLTVKEAEDKEPLRPGHAYLAPAGYHLLIEEDKTFSLSVDPRVNYCCPSIDVLFESATDAFGPTLIGVVLTGANSDGSRGLKSIKMHGGLAIVQNPETAEARAMPQAALEATAVDHIVNLGELAPLLKRLAEPEKEEDHERIARG